jgi:hypothetical protein
VTEFTPGITDDGESAQLIGDDVDAWTSPEIFVGTPSRNWAIIENHRRGEGPMQITLELPDDIAKGLESQVKNLPRALLESFALEGYRSGKLTEEQVRRILGYGTRMQVDGFLKEHGVYLAYNLEDVDRESETSREFSSR